MGGFSRRAGFCLPRIVLLSSAFLTGSLLALCPGQLPPPPQDPVRKAAPPLLEGLQDLVVIIRTGSPEAVAYADALERALWKALTYRRIRCLVLVESPQQGNAAEIASQIDLFRPKWRMTWTERGAGFLGKQQNKTLMHIELCSEGVPEPRWVHEVSLSGGFVLNQEKLARDAVDALLFALEEFPHVWAPNLPGPSNTDRKQLSKAIIQGRYLKVKQCLDAGELLNSRDPWGWTPLLWAVQNGDPVMVKWLLRRGADPNLSSSRPRKKAPQGTTPLGLACLSGQEGMLKPLLVAGANPDAVDTEGRSARDRAASLGRTTFLQILDTPPEALRLAKASPLGGNLQDLYVLIRSTAPGSRVYLGHLRALLEAELKARKVRCLVHLEDLLGMNTEHRAAQLAAFHPACQLTWDEREVTFVRDSRQRSILSGSLQREGYADPVWKSETTAVSKVIFEDKELAEEAVYGLMAALEADQLLQSQSAVPEGR